MNICVLADRNMSFIFLEITSLQLQSFTVNDHMTNCCQRPIGCHQAVWFKALSNFTVKTVDDTPTVIDACGICFAGKYTQDIQQSTGHPPERKHTTKTTSTTRDIKSTVKYNVHKMNMYQKGIFPLSF